MYRIAKYSPLGLLSHTPNHKSLELGKNVQGLWIDPLPSSLITSKLEQWCQLAKVSPQRIPGYWIHKQRKNENGEPIVLEMGSHPSPDEKVLLFLHGGAYVLGSAHTDYINSNVAKEILGSSSTTTRTLLVEYRLSALPHMEVAEEDRNPFPAALVDAIQAYFYLVRVVGFKEEQVVVVGDSAGGNLALALTRYLVEYGHRDHVGLGSVDSENGMGLKAKEKKDEIPGVPGHLVLSSPWVDMTGSFASSPLSSHYSNRRTDYLRLPSSPNAIDAPIFFISPFGPTITKDPYVSPACKDLTDAEVPFVGFPRTFICAGGGEVLLDQIVFLKERMERAGVEVVYVEGKDAFHDYLVFVVAEPERGLTLDAIRAFLDGDSSGI